MKTVKVYRYKENGVDCTDLVLEDKIYPFLTEAVKDDEITDLYFYGSYPLEGNLPSHAELVREYKIEE